MSEVRQLKILEHKTADRDIVRVAELPSVLLVSNKLRSFIESNHLTGVSFGEIDDFTIP